MNRILLVALLLLASLRLCAQNARIPSSEELRRLGLSEDQIRQAEELRNSNVNPSSLPFLTDSVNVPDTTAKARQPAASVKPPARKPAVRDSAANARNTVKSAIYGQQIFRNSNIELFEQAGDGKAPDNYVLGAGDELSVAIWGFSVYNEKLRISEDGYISSKLIGRVYLKGLSFSSARSLLRRRFTQVTDLNNSEFDVSLVYSKIITVNVVGEVVNPGSYTVPSINTAFNVLVAAKGPLPIGSVRNIYIKREGKIVDTLDVYKFLMDPSANPDIFLQNKDYVIVPVATRVISISGEIKRPNTYELKNSENLMSLITFAGGFNSTAFKSNVQIYRYLGNKRVLIDVNADSLMAKGKDFLLNDADSINVSKIGNQLEQKVSVYGAVRSAGDFELKEGDRVSDLIRRAQGVASDAYLNRAYIYRQKDDLTRFFIPLDLSAILSSAASSENIVLKNRDELRIMSKKDFSDTLTFTVSGSVHKPGRYDFSSGINLRDALFLAGGFVPGADNTRIEIARVLSYSENGIFTPTKTIIKSFEIKNSLFLDKDAASFRLEPFDEIFVRKNPSFETPTNVVILGEVQYPGKYALLRRDEKASEIIARAGGLTEYAFLEGVKMYREKDSIGYVYLNVPKALKRPKSRYNEVLVDGDSIIIPKTTNLVLIAGAHGNASTPQLSAPYSGRRAGYYVRNFAGGFTSISLRRKVYVIQANGIARGTVNLGLFHIYPKVTRGSAIFIPVKPPKIKAEEKPFDWNGFIEKTTIKLTGLLTLYILSRSLIK
jgi:polysaccharide biosynthesis/export protein